MQVNVSFVLCFAGKWHVGFHEEDYMPTRRGFDTFRGFLLAGGDHYTHTRSALMSTPVP